MHDKSKSVARLPTRARGVGNPSPSPHPGARVGIFLVVGAALAALALSFEIGRFYGHREGIEYAEEKTWMVEFATLVLEEAADSTHACHDLAQYLKTAPQSPQATRRRLNVAKRALTEPCRNCGGE